jgi:hypothetical protein
LRPLDSSTRELIAFAGPVQCEVAHGAINLVLRGFARATQGPRCGLTEVLFSGASAVALPLELRDARVIELAAELEAAPAPAPAAGVAPRRFRIESPEVQLELQARSAQLHRDAAAAFFGAVPPPRVPLRLRLGWSLLLMVLRIPGAEALVRKFRGST